MVISEQNMEKFQRCEYYSTAMVVCLGDDSIDCSSCRSGHQCSLSCTANAGRNLCVVRVLLKELEEHHLTAKADMMLSARTKPIHGD